MKFTADDLLAFAHRKADGWSTLYRNKPFKCKVTESGIEYTRSDLRVKIARKNLQAFCEAFRRNKGSFRTSKYLNFGHASYSLALIKRFLESQGKRP